MLRRTEFYECVDSDDLKDAIRYAKQRTDGGHTVIDLDKNTTYYLAEPLDFGCDVRITLNCHGLVLEYNANGVCFIPTQSNAR